MWKIIYLLYLPTFVTYGESSPLGDVNLSSSKKKGCVIGAGGGGLAMVKQFAAYPHEFETIGFESNSDVGGLWIYTDLVDLDERGLPVHSLVYKNMRANSPRQLMHYEDFQPFAGRENRTCPKHETVLEYLRNYTDHYNLRQYIRFNTLVDKIIPIFSDKDDWRTTKWSVHSKDLVASKTDVTICDAVVIASGRDRKPNIPNIPGIENFHGRIIHSRSYRRPENFINQTVIILGAGTSGVDISVDVSSRAKKVYLSHRNDKIVSEWPDNVEQVRGVVSYNGNQFVLQDNSTISADAFIYCTGYLYDYPIIDQNSSEIIVKDKHVYPLYKQSINARHPSMAFFGIPSGPVIAFDVFYVQAKYYVALLQGKFELPSLEDRLKDAELPNGVPESDAHVFQYIGQFSYFKELADAAGFDNLPAIYVDEIAAWAANEKIDPTYFRQSELQFKDGKIEITYPHGKGRNFHDESVLL